MQYEAEEQATLFRWAKLCRQQFPEIELLYHIPNGGNRDIKEAANLKRQGVKAGVPDLCLPVARGGWHGLYIELKVGRNKPTEKQEAWIRELSKQGYAVKVCYGWEAASRVIRNYLGAGG